MVQKSLLIRFVALVAAMMCALGMQAQEAYCNYTPSNKTLTFYYNNLKSSRQGTTYYLDEYSMYSEYDLIPPVWSPDWTHGNPSDISWVVFDPSFAGARPESTAYWFRNMQHLLSITGMNYLNTSEVTDMSGMFYSCSSLRSIDLSGFNTSKVSEMSDMLSWCLSLTSLDVSGFNTAISMNSMFRGCSSLTSLNLESFATLLVENLSQMFYNCGNLRTITVSDS